MLLKHVPTLALFVAVALGKIHVDKQPPVEPKVAAALKPAQPAQPAVQAKEGANPQFPAVPMKEQPILAVEKKQTTNQIQAPTQPQGMKKEETMKKAEEVKKVETAKKVEDVKKTEQTRQVMEPKRPNEPQQVKKAEDTKKVEEVKKIDIAKQAEQTQKKEETQRIEAPKEEQLTDRRPGHHDHEKVDPNAVNLKVGSSWTQFLFGQAGTWVEQQFLVHTHSCAMLKITDYFCSGDRFAIYINDKFVGDSSSTVFNNCTSKTICPTYAFYHEPWSSFEYSLTPGRYKVTIKVLSSPYGEGYGAIRVDPILNKCCLSLNGLTLINSPVSHCSAEFACKSYGLELADIDIYNFNDATQVVFGCAGPFSSAWIKSYWGNTYHNSCLALYTGSAAPGGSISTPPKCHEQMPVLCKGKTHNCVGPFLHA